MTASPTPQDQAVPSQVWVTAPVIDYEPAPQPLAQKPCPTPSGAALHRSSPRPLRTRRRPALEPPPPKAAALFAETTLRQVIEVMDRRRPIAQLRPLMTPFLIDCVIASACAPRTGSATLRRVRVRSVSVGATGEVTAAEVFATFSRSGRVHAVAGRIERYRDSWRLVALQIG
jgi:hypothetical protein